MKVKEVIEKLEKAKVIFKTDGQLLYALNETFGYQKYNFHELGDWILLSPRTRRQKRACIENSIAHYKSLDPEAEV